VLTKVLRLNEKLAELLEKLSFQLKKPIKNLLPQDLKLSDFKTEVKADEMPKCIFVFHDRTQNVLLCFRHFLKWRKPLATKLEWCKKCLEIQQETGQFYIPIPKELETCEYCGNYKQVRVYKKQGIHGEFELKLCDECVMKLKKQGVLTI